MVSAGAAHGLHGRLRSLLGTQPRGSCALRGHSRSSAAERLLLGTVCSLDAELVLREARGHRGRGAVTQRDGPSDSGRSPRRDSRYSRGDNTQRHLAWESWGLPVASQVQARAQGANRP